MALSGFNTSSRQYEMLRSVLLVYACSNAPQIALAILIGMHPLPTC